MVGRTRRVAAAVAVIALSSSCLLFLPSAVLADKCGGPASVAPDHGPPGTIFVFTANVGERSDLTFYHDGAWAGSVFLPGSGDVSYSIHSTAADIGHWRARAAVRSYPDCYGEAEFEVDSVPSVGDLTGVSALVMGSAVVMLIVIVLIALRHRGARSRR